MILYDIMTHNTTLGAVYSIGGAEKIVQKDKRDRYYQFPQIRGGIRVGII
jgi:hypothetical protein